MGDELGDKGKAWEKFLADELRRRGIDARQIHGTDICDIFVAGIGLIQAKHCDTKTRPNTFTHYCRNSKSEEKKIEKCKIFEGVSQHGSIDNSEIRKLDIEKRLKISILANGDGHTKVYLHNASSFNMENKLYIITELGDDGELHHHGTFLKNRNYYRSPGGKNGRQTHFRIKFLGLEEVGCPDPFFDKIV